MMAKTVFDVLEHTVQHVGERPALRIKQAGQWQTCNWRDYREQVMQVGRGLVELGLEPGQAVVIMSSNRPEWFFAHLGAMAAGGIATGLYTSSNAAQCHCILRHAEAAVAVVENIHYLQILLSFRRTLPKLKTIILLEGETAPQHVYSWQALLALGRQIPEAKLKQRMAIQEPNSLCSFLYTSGTTGFPKAVMLSHRNIVWSIQTLLATYAVSSDDNVLSYLPLSHVAEQMVSLYLPLAAGSCTWFAESLDTLQYNLREVRPQIFFAVPKAWEKIQATGHMAIQQQNPGIKKWLVTKAHRLNLRNGYAQQRQHDRKPLFFGLARRLVLRKMREQLGLDRARLCFSSTASVALSTLEFFLKLDLPILEIYEISECTGLATFSTPRCYRTGKSGIPLPGTEVRIAGDGEILIRGPHVFLGYYKNEEATRAVLDEEGWLYSGDIGTLDGKGFLTVTDRKKELIITSSGQNVAPQSLELRLKAIPGVAQAVVMGDSCNYLAALLVLDPAQVSFVARLAGSRAQHVKEAIQCPRFKAHFQQQVLSLNREALRQEIIQRIALLPDEFTVAGGELTPTHKLKRQVIYEKYTAVIAELYR